jgi:DNA-binding transcriptional LysR family regulator
MDLRHLEAFLAVAEAGGFRRAAARTYVSQPALSAQIRDLERFVGATLLVRHSGGVELTAAGRALVEPAQRVLDTVREARRMVELTRHRGAVVLGVMPGAAGELTRPLIAELARRLPTVSFEIRVIPLSQWTPRVLDDVDLLMTCGPWPESSQLTTHLLSEPFVVAYPRQWVPAHAVPSAAMSLDECFSMPMVNVAPSTAKQVVEYWRLSWLTGTADVRVAGPPVRETVEVLGSILSGHCAAIAPQWVTRAYPGNGMATAKVEGAPQAEVRMISRSPADGLVEAIHHEVAKIAEQLRPWVVPPSEDGPIRGAFFV